jgi:hypothetical protein
MAGEIIKGLFGISPYELSKQREQEGSAQDYRLAQLSPEQMLQYHAVSGARAMGEGIRGVFNVQDPQMRDSTVVDATTRRMAQSGVDLNSSTGLKQLLAELNQQGVSPQIMQRVGEAAQQYAMREQQIAAQASQQQQEAAMREAIAALPPDATPDQIAAVTRQFAEPDSVFRGAAYLQRIEQENKVKLAQQAAAGASAQALAMLKAQQAKELERLKASLKTSGGDSGGDKPSNSRDRKFEMEVEERIQGYETLDRSMSDVEKILDREGGIYTGNTYNELMKQATKQTGGFFGNKAKMQNTEEMMNVIRQNIIPMLANFKPASDSDIRVLESMLSGDTKLDEKTIRTTAKQWRDVAKREIGWRSKYLKNPSEGKRPPEKDPLGLFQGE